MARRSICRSAPCAAAFALLALSSRAGAAGPEISELSASVSGAGGAATAREGDPAAAHFNPSALADGKGFRTAVGSAFAISFLMAKSEDPLLTSPYELSNEPSVRAIPHAYVSYAHRSVVFGIAANVPYASSVQWPSDSALRFETISSNLRIFRIAPFFGARHQRFRVAAGPDIDFGSLDIERATNHVTAEGHMHLLLNGSALGAQISAFFEASERVQLGISYKSRSVLKLRGDADFDVPAVFGYVDQGVSARFRFPDRIAIGAALRFPRARGYADLVFSTWSVNTALTFDFERDPPKSSRLANDWRDTLALRAGGELDLGRHFVARAGVFLDGFPGPAAPVRNLAPNAPDATRVGASLGGGITLPLARDESGAPKTTLGFDAFYEGMWLLSRTSTSDTAPLATYSGHAHIVGLGARLDVDPARK